MLDASADASRHEAVGAALAAFLQTQCARAAKMSKMSQGKPVVNFEGHLPPAAYPIVEADPWKRK